MYPLSSIDANLRLWDRETDEAGFRAAGGGVLLR